jgi:hypothetical protein
MHTPQEREGAGEAQITTPQKTLDAAATSEHHVHLGTKRHTRPAHRSDVLAGGTRRVHPWMDGNLGGWVAASTRREPRRNKGGARDIVIHARGELLGSYAHGPHGKRTAAACKGRRSAHAARVSALKGTRDGGAGGLSASGAAGLEAHGTPPRATARVTQPARAAPRTWGACRAGVGAAGPRAERSARSCLRVSHRPGARLRGRCCARVRADGAEPSAKSGGAPKAAALSASQLSAKERGAVLRQRPGRPGG